MNIKLPFRRKSREARGRAIYMEKIRPLVYPQETGKIVVIDLHTGDYEMTANPRDEVPAQMRLLERRPDADIWRKRVGFQTVHAFGGLQADKDG